MYMSCKFLLIMIMQIGDLLWKRFKFGRFKYVNFCMYVYNTYKCHDNRKFNYVCSLRYLK